MLNLEVLIGKTAAKKIADNNLNVLQCSEDSIQYLIGKKAAEKIKAAKQLCTFNVEHLTITSSKNIAEIFNDMKYLDIEQMHVLCLDRRNKVISKFMLSSGGRFATLCDTASLFKRILLSNANGFAIVHNHPSGTNAPSQTDIDLTKKIKEGSKLLDLNLIDHVIIAGDNYFSFVDSGYL
jgi:DNA repair protein RadC